MGHEHFRTRHRILGIYIVYACIYTCTDMSCKHGVLQCFLQWISHLTVQLTLNCSICHGFLPLVLLGYVYQTVDGLQRVGSIFLK